MRSIGRVEEPGWLSDEPLKAAGARRSEPIEIFWGNPMPGTANGRGPGKRGCIMISVRLPVDAAGVLRLPSPVCSHGTPTVLAINLNCSELKGWPGPQALLMADSGSPPGIMCLFRAPSGYATATLAPSKGR